MGSLLDVFYQEVARYFSEGGDEVIRYNYDLSPDSVVFDVGGYIGDFAEGIHRRFSSNIFVFEPVKAYYKICENRFIDYDKVKVNSFGIGGSNGDFPIYINGDMTSSNTGSEIEEVIQLVTLSEAMKKFNLQKISLLKLNIEGDEYNLLEQAIKDECLKNVENIQIQYHLNIEDCENRKQKITQELQKTHTLEWKYDWVWESWKIK